MRIDDLPAASDVPTVTAAEMAKVDRTATLELGVPEVALMENAGHQTAVAVRLLLGDVVGKRVVALVGRGNNGADALVAARHLFGWGADARALLAHPLERMRPLGQTHAAAARNAGMRVVSYDPDAPDELAGADLIIDGLLGYSGSGVPREDIAALVRAANRSRVPILALDLPSGLHPDTGAPQGVTIRAACTVTLALPKTGLVVTASRALVGELLLADIGIPAAAYGRADVDPARIFGRGDLVRIIR